jgi:hypothetical protein
MKSFVLLLGVAIIGYIGWWRHNLAHEAELVSRISVGDTEEKVLAIVGQPAIINHPPEHMWCSEPNLSHEYMYGTRIFASWSVISFNKDDKVVCNLKLESP